MEERTYERARRRIEEWEKGGGRKSKRGEVFLSFFNISYRGEGMNAIYPVAKKR